MAKKAQIHAEVPEWRYRQFEKLASANNLSKTEFLNKMIDRESSLLNGQTIIISNPSAISEKTLRELVLGN